MSTYRERRRHYRVGAKESGNPSVKRASSVYRIPKKRARKWAACAIVFCILVFVKGIIIGRWLSE